MRSIVAIAMTIAVVATASNIFGAERRIDLDLPGNLATIERQHPTHFAKIERILAEVSRRAPEDHVAEWMRTEFQARDVRYTDLIMTSDPPKRRLEFTLDKTSYVKVITLETRAKALSTTKKEAAK